MEEIYVNVKNERSVHSRAPADGRRCHGAVLCLGLLSVVLSAGLVGLSVSYYNSTVGAADELSSTKTNLTERLQDSKDQLSALTEERDRLDASVNQMADKLKALQRLSTQSSRCPAGWTVSCCSCYYLSAESESWTKASKDCQRKGAHLVVIDTADEQTFLSGFADWPAWVGLSDRDEEKTWEWIDGSPLTLTYWLEKQPDNGGEYGTVSEDCAHITADTAEWNDLPCENPLHWICEKPAQHG